MNSDFMKIVGLTFTLFLVSLNCDAHALVADNAGVIGNSWSFILSGISHIIPSGFDHILFIVGLFLTTRNLRSILLLATSFTLAHSITLILSATGYLPSYPQIIEPIIGLSIVMIGLQAFMSDFNSGSSYLIVFVFGLIHGCGFATALAETGIPEKYFYSSLICFNLGIELAQVIIILFLYLIFRLWRNEKQFQKIIVRPVSLLIALSGMILTAGRIFES